MKHENLLRAVGGIDDELILEAHRGAGRRGVLRRRGLALLAAAALLLAMFTTAFAVSGQFRAAVISLLRLDVPESVPQMLPSDGSPIGVVSDARVDGRVQASYLRIDGDFEYEDGVIYSWPGDEFAQGRYDTVEDGALKPLAVKRFETVFACRGERWQVRFDYAQTPDGLYVHNLPDSRMSDDYETENLFAYAGAAADGRVLLTLPFPHANLRYYSEYKVLLDPETGGITDFLAGCSLEKLTNFVHEIALSDDLRYALVTCFSADGGGYQSYEFCDVASKSLRPVEELTGQTPDGCWLLDDTTLFFYAGETGYRVDLATGARERVYDGLPVYNDRDGGLQFLGGRYALLILAGRQAALLDLRSGNRVPVGDFDFTILTGASVNRDGTRIFLHVYDDGGGIARLGMLDIAAGTLTLLDREGEQVRPEWDVGWFDGRRIAVRATEDYRSYFLYLYDFSGGAE